jgi:hypothetical protein
MLVDADEIVHTPGEAVNWNESRYIDFWDAASGVGGWIRIGNRPNAQYSEMTVCIYLPDGRVAFNFERAPIDENGLTAGGQTWEIVEPWRENRVIYRGEVILLDDPWALGDPKTAFTQSPRAEADIDVRCLSAGLDAVLGKDQDHIDLIFLPGQTDFHYQHLARTVGTIRIGDDEWQVDGRGGKDHSWGPRNWHAKIWLRWLIAASDDANGFMLTRAVGPTKKTRSGFVLDDGVFHVVDEFDMRNTYAGAPHFELRKVEAEIRSGDRVWSAVGTPRNWLPARHRQHNEAGDLAVLRIVKSPVDWELDGRAGIGHTEYHDIMEDGRPVGLHD